MRVLTWFAALTSLGTSEEVYKPDHLLRAVVSISCDEQYGVRPTSAEAAYYQHMTLNGVDIYDRRISEPGLVET